MKFRFMLYLHLDRFIRDGENMLTQEEVIELLSSIKDPFYIET